MDLLKSRQEALSRLSLNRTQVAMTAISDISVELLKSDLPRQKEFREAKNVALIFGDDVVMVDGEANFAESSNVILKNAAILALFSAATLDEKFFHPRFLLMDNVEDKGMEDERSHNFQKLIVARSEAAVFEHQIIFTTSTIAPELNIPAYAIGPSYDHDNKTLKIL